MPRGDYDRSSITRASEYVHNREPDYLAWRAQRLRDNNSVRAARSDERHGRGDQRRHQDSAMELAVSEASSETIARTRTQIAAELAADRMQSRRENQI